MHVSFQMLLFTATSVLPEMVGSKGTNVFQKGHKIELFGLKIISGTAEAASFATGTTQGNEEITFICQN